MNKNYLEFRWLPFPFRVKAKGYHWYISIRSAIRGIANKVHHERHGVNERRLASPICAHKACIDQDAGHRREASLDHVAGELKPIYVTLVGRDHREDLPLADGAVILDRKLN